MSASSTPALSRRRFMVGAAGMTFAFVIGDEPPASPATEAASMTEKTFNPWVSIAPNGDISIIAPAREMGQGSLTSLPLIFAEEPDADWSRVVVVPAPPIDKIYGSPGFGHVMHTASSEAVAGFFTILHLWRAGS